MQAFILSPYSWKAYGIRLNLPGLCNIGKLFHRLPWPAFILGFSALFTLRLVCPHLWTFRTCGNTIVGFCFSTGQSHALHDSWLEDRHDGADASLSIHNAIQHHSRPKFSSFSIQFGPTPLFHPPNSTIGYPALSPYIGEHQTRHHKHPGPANR